MSDNHRTFSYSITLDGNWLIAQCLEVDIASQGKSIEEAISNLREALELHFEEPTATIMPHVGQIEIELGVA